MRKEKIITVTAEGRDKGRTYLIREMSAFRAERWGARVLLALMKSGAPIPEDAAKMGLAGVAALGVKLLLSIQWEDAQPLLNEMMGCVQISQPLFPKPGDAVSYRDINEDADDIEEVATMLMLRKEVLELHLGFSLREKLQSFGLSREQENSASTSATQM